MDKSLTEYMPKASEFKIINKSSIGGESKTTKFPDKVQPPLAR